MAGRNIGEAFVLDNSGLINTIGRNIDKQRQDAALRQKKIDEESAHLMSKMDKLNAKGIQKQDLPEFNKKYSELKDLYYKYRSASTDAERMAAKMDVDDKWKDASQYVNQAVVGRQQLGQWASNYINHPDKYDDNVKSEISSMLDKPISQIDFDKVNPLNRERLVDTSKVFSKFDSIDNHLVSGAGFGKEVLTPFKVGENRGTKVQRSREVSSDAQLARYTEEYKNSPETRMALQKLYPASSPEEQVKLFADARRSQGSMTKPLEDKFIKNPTPRKGKGGGSDGEALTLLQDLAYGVARKDSGKINTIKSSLPKGSTVGFSPDGKTFKIDVPDGITPDGLKVRMPVSETFDVKDPDFTTKVAYFLKDTDVGKNLPYLQKLLKEKGKPSSAYRPPERTDDSKKAVSKLSTNTLNFFKKK